MERREGYVAQRKGKGRKRHRGNERKGGRKTFSLSLLSREIGNARSAQSLHASLFRARILVKSLPLYVRSISALVRHHVQVRFLPLSLAILDIHASPFSSGSMRPSGPCLRMALLPVFAPFSFSRLQMGNWKIGKTLHSVTVEWLQRFFVERKEKLLFPV